MKKVDNEKYFLDTGISNLAFPPLLLWLILSLVKIIKNKENFLTLFFNPLNVIFGILFFILIIYHLHYEIYYLINVYIQNNKYKKILKNIIIVITYPIIFFVVLSILKIHFNSILVL